MEVLKKMFGRIQMKSLIKKQNALKVVLVLSALFIVTIQINANTNTSIAFLNLDTLGNLDSSEIIDNANREILTPERKNLEAAVQKRLADISKTGGVDIPGTKDKSYKEVVKKDAGFLLESDRFKKLSDKVLNVLKEKEYSTDEINKGSLTSNKEGLKVLDKTHVVSEVSSLLRKKSDEAVSAPDYNNVITSNPVDRSVKANTPPAQPQDKTPPQAPKPDQPPQGEGDEEPNPGPRSQRPVLNNPDAEDLTDKVNPEGQQPDMEYSFDEAFDNDPSTQGVNGDTVSGISGEDVTGSGVSFSGETAVGGETSGDDYSLNIGTDTQANIYGTDVLNDIDFRGAGTDTIFVGSTEAGDSSIETLTVNPADVALDHVTTTTQGGADFVTVEQLFSENPGSFEDSSEEFFEGETLDSTSDADPGATPPEPPPPPE
jgi:hypothetical protein